MNIHHPVRSCRLCFLQLNGRLELVNSHLTQRRFLPPRENKMDMKQPTNCSSSLSQYTSSLPKKLEMHHVKLAHESYFKDDDLDRVAHLRNLQNR